MSKKDKQHKVRKSDLIPDKYKDTYEKDRERYLEEKERLENSYLKDKFMAIGKHLNYI